MVGDRPLVGVDKVQYEEGGGRGISFNHHHLRGEIHGFLPQVLPVHAWMLFGDSWGFHHCLHDLLVSEACVSTLMTMLFLGCGKRRRCD